MKKSKGLAEKNFLAHLNQIIATQAALAAANFDVTAFMDLVVQRMQALTPATGVVIELVEGEDMVYKAAIGSVKNHIGLRLAKRDSLSGLCVITQQILRSDDTEKDVRVNRMACRLVQARSLMVAPLFHKGEAIGALKILSKDPQAFSDYDVKTLQLMAGFIGSALAYQLFYETTQKLLAEKTAAFNELAKTKEKMQYLAHHDNLTGLVNRSLFLDRLSVAIEQCRRRQESLALFYIDIDHFKTINDTYGHALGDELLIAFAQRVHSVVRKMDTVARLGGDEFVILLQTLPNETVAVTIAKKIIQQMEKVFALSNQKLIVTTSIGIAFYTTNLTSDEFIACADNALYAAKQAGRNTFKIYKQP